MTDIADLARHWMRQSQLGKGLRLDPTQVDALNALGVGELILAAVARVQREQCLRRTMTSIQGAGIGSLGIESGMEASEAHSFKSSGMTRPENETANCRPAHRRSKQRKTRSTGSTSNGKKASPAAQHAEGHTKALAGAS